MFVTFLALYLPQTFDQLILTGHSGFAGPHMLAVSANMFEAPYLARVEHIYSNGAFEPYNHHPPLFFLIQSLVLETASNFDQKLRYSYSLASFFWMSGIVSVFAFLRYYGLGYLSTCVAVSGLILAWWSKQFLFLAMYDSASILLSTGMIFAISQYEKSPSTRRLLILYVTSIVALLISWYVVFIIFCYGSWKIVKAVYEKEAHILFTNRIFWYSCHMAVLTFLSMSIMYWQLTIINDMNLGIMTKYMLHTMAPFEIRPHIDRNELVLLLKQLWASFAFMPVLIIYLASLLLMKILSSREKYVLTGIKHKEIVQVSIIVLIACTFFHLLMYRWSNIHPFIFLWLMPIFAIIFAFAMENIMISIRSIQNLVKKVSGAIILSMLLAISVAISTQKIISYDIFDPHISKLFEDFKELTMEKQAVVQVIEGESQSKYCPNYGIQIFLSSHPNLSFKNIVPEGYQHVVIECEEDATTIRNLTSEISKVVGE